MTFEQLRRTAVILGVCVLLVVAFASARTLSPSKSAVDARPPVAVQAIQPEQRFEDRWTELRPPARPIERALAKVHPWRESAPTEQVPFIRQAIADPTPMSSSGGRMAQAKKVERDPVCGTKGRRYFKLNGRQVWRCIR